VAVPIKRGTLTGKLRVWRRGEGNFLRILKYERRKQQMAEVKKSKTDVGARMESKNKASFCSNCGKKVEVVLAVSPNGKKRMRRLCCEA
jgi:hypothetical protein